jgi:hypothetical protein
MPTASDLENIELCPSPVAARGVSMQAPDSTLRVGFTVPAYLGPVDARGAYEFCAPSVQFASSDPGVAIGLVNGLVTGRERRERVYSRQFR